MRVLIAIYYLRHYAITSGTNLRLPPEVTNHTTFRLVPQLHYTSIIDYRSDIEYMATLINCGFAREVVLSGTTTYKSKVFDRILQDFHDRFGDLPDYYTTKSPLKVKFRAYATFIHKKKVAVSVKQQICGAFSGEKWRELTREQKEAHTLKDCRVRKPY